MASPYVGEIRMFAGTYIPDGWALCNGQLLDIFEYQQLYSLLGTTYGGDGQRTFAVPDLQGRAPIHKSSTYPLAAKGGIEQVTLTTDQIPSHTHVPLASSAAGTSSSPQGTIWAESTYFPYANDTPDTAMKPLAPTGGSQPHDNMMPYLVINYIIALNGIYPSAN